MNSKLRSEKWAATHKGNYYLEGPPTYADELEVGIYNLEWDANKSDFYLHFVSLEYKMPDKVYGTDTKFINWILKTNSVVQDNIGVLLSGVKGTGKSVTAKQLCNKLGMPVILVANHFHKINSFLNRIKQPIVVFVDEFEKVFANRTDELLSLMDGCLNNGYKKFFLLTSNELNINDNMLDRPGRVRYHQKYNGLKRHQIIELLEMGLNNPTIERINGFVETAMKLEVRTIDTILKAIEEMNIHNCNIEDFKDFFNFTFKQKRYEIYSSVDGVKFKLQDESKKVPKMPFNEEETMGLIYDFQYERFTVVGVVNYNTFKVESEDGNLLFYRFDLVEDTETD